MGSRRARPLLHHRRPSARRTNRRRHRTLPLGATPVVHGADRDLVGIGLALGNWAALAALAILPTVGLLIRIHDEERLLLEELGEPYRRFASDRARLFPGVW
jgi:hypothetical protein